MTYVLYITNTWSLSTSKSPEEVSFTPRRRMPQSLMFCSLTKSSVLVSLLKAASTSQPAEHKTHRRQLDAIWQEKVYNKSQAAWPGKDKTSPAIRSSSLFHCWKLEFSFHVEIIFFPTCAFWSPPLYLALCPLSSCTAVAGLCHVAPETSTHHPLSQTYRLYIVDRKVLGAALLPFSPEQRLWVTFKHDTIAEESLRGSVLIAAESRVLWREQERPPSGPAFLQVLQLGFINNSMAPKKPGCKACN